MDHLTNSQLDPNVMAEIVSGIAAACREAGCALLRGETAEMVGDCAPGSLDVVGTIVGIVERANILPRADLRAGDLLIGLPSSGPHTNGYPLICKVFEGIPLEMVFPDLGIPLADALLAPHRSYLQVLQHAMPHVKALVHLTAGAFVENIPRVLPNGLSARVRLDSWDVPPLFRLIQLQGDVPPGEMYRVFNMGIGMVVIVARENAEALEDLIGEPTCVIGELVSGENKVILEGETRGNRSDNDRTAAPARRW